MEWNDSSSNSSNSSNSNNNQICAASLGRDFRSKSFQSSDVGLNIALGVVLALIKMPLYLLTLYLH